MRHFAHHIGDYAAATAHLSFVEDAAYHRLLRRYYQDEHALPADVERVCRIVGAKSRHEKKAISDVLAEFFTLESDGWHQSRADQVINDYKAKVNQARTNGVSGGRPPSVQSKKLTINQEPRTNNSEAKASGAKAPAREVIFQECLPWLEQRSGKNCRALVGKWLSEIKDDEAMRQLLEHAEQENPVDPVGWVSARLKPKEPHETWNERRIRLGREALRDSPDDRH